MRDRLVDVPLEMRGSEAVAPITGEIDSSNAHELRAALFERLPPETRCLVLDLSETRYLDSSGVELLFELAGRLATRRQSLRLVVPGDSPLRRVVELCDVESVVTVDETVDDALAR